MIELCNDDTTEYRTVPYEYCYALVQGRTVPFTYRSGRRGRRGIPNCAQPLLETADRLARTGTVT